MPKEKSTHRVRKHRALLASVPYQQFLSNISDSSDADDEISVAGNAVISDISDHEHNEQISQENENNELRFNFENNESEMNLLSSAESASSNLEGPGLREEFEEDLLSSNESILTNFEENDIIEIPQEGPDEVNQLRVLAVKDGIEQSTLDKLFKILRPRLLPELPKSSKTFLGTSSATYDIREMQDSDGSFGEYVYFGIEKGLVNCIDPDVFTEATIYLQFNVDGISLTKSGDKDFWVMSGKVYYKPDIYKPFPILIYCGKSKPNSVDEFLADFIHEITILQTTGVIIMNHRYNVCIHCLINDTPARAFIKCTKGHTGFFSCERCEIKGLKLNRVTQFPLINCPERTDNSFRRGSQRQHHKGISPLLQIDPPINMISMFILDAMHLLYEGVMKRLLINWFLIRGQANVGQQMKTEVSRRLLLIRKGIPCEFQRKTRSLKSLKKFKATEFKFILLYAGPIVLLNVLNEDRFKNFMLLHVASRILCNDELIEKYQGHAKNYLQRFFLGLYALYPTMQVMNSHGAIHIADDVVNMGCNLNLISAFSFENFLGNLTSLIRTPNRPLAQICRRLHELDSIDPPKPQKPHKIQILKRNGSNVLKIKYNECTLTAKSPDNIVLLQNNSIFKINLITIREQRIEIQGKFLRIKRSMFIYPTDSKDLYMWELRKSSNGEMSHFDINCIKKKMILLKLNLSERAPMRMFCMPLLHQ